VGSTEGEVLEALVRSTERSTEGLRVGARVGSTLGAKAGAKVGAEVGTLEGAKVGSTDHGKEQRWDPPKERRKERGWGGTQRWLQRRAASGARAGSGRKGGTKVDQQRDER
jgi:hypothetical protein